MTHLTYTNLLSYIGNCLPEADQAQIESHLFSDHCEPCGGKFSRLHAVLEAVSKDRSVAPPSAVLRKALDLDLKRPLASAAQPFLQMLAKLQFDSRLQLSPLLVRGPAGPKATRHMLFSTPQLDIDLEITPQGNDHSVVGQILDTEQANEPSLAFVSLKNDTGEVLQGAETDSLGQFTFSQVPTGVYDLIFDLESQEVFISSLELINDQ
jgi:hypothetical protein